MYVWMDFVVRNARQVTSANFNDGRSRCMCGGSPTEYYGAEDQVHLYSSLCRVYVTRKKIVDRACSQAHFVSLKQSMVNRSRYGSLERRYKVYLLGCAIYSRLHEVPNIYGTTCVA
ncbi:hypothetical protein GQ600_14239 [Phytophthora cactorum]|nr:hypothetical protein GQ600_14239 [Phytophthora cactorum]